MDGLNYINIIAQLLGIIAFTISCARYFQKKKTTMMTTGILSYVFYIIHYIMIGAFAGSYTLILAIIRDYYIYLREKHHKKHRHRKLYNNLFVFLGLFFIYVVLIAINLDTPANILPLFAGLVYLFFEWFTTNKTTMEFASGLTTLPWVAYDIISFSIPALLSDLVSLFVCAIGIFKDNRHKKHKR